MLADCLVTLGFWGFLPARETYPQARAAALRALELVPSHAESRAALGMVLWHLSWDLDGAERELRRAVELGPSDEVARMSLAMFLVLIRNAVEDGEEQARIALALDPLSLSMNFSCAWFHVFAGRWETAIEAANKTLEMYPHALHACYVRGWAALALGDVPASVAAFDRSAAMSPDPMSAAYLAIAHARAAHPAARSTYVDLKARQAAGQAAPFALAMVSAALGNRDDAFGWLEASFEQRHSRLFWLRVRPFFDPLRGDPRFDDCLDRLGGPRVPR